MPTSSSVNITIIRSIPSSRRFVVSRTLPGSKPCAPLRSVTPSLAYNIYWCTLVRTIFIGVHLCVQYLLVYTCAYNMYWCTLVHTIFIDILLRIQFIYWCTLAHTIYSLLYRYTCAYNIFEYFNFIIQYLLKIIHPGLFFASISICRS